MKQIEYLGKLGFHIHVEVTTNEMSSWKPEFIAEFFAGAAQMMRAMEKARTESREVKP